MSENLNEQLDKDLSTCRWFSIQCDESVDSSSTAQLMVFIRMVFADFSTKEELLTLIPLRTTTRGVDIYNAIKTFFVEKKCRWRSSCRYMLLGDSAYISRDYTFIVTPKRDNGALTVQDQQRNPNICRGRVVVEQAFGRVKCKWRRMRDLQNTRLDVVVMLIMSACILHNLCTGPADMCEDHPAGCPRHEDENI
ncbi:hypothetical protein AAFF_G00159050 [Aldrovandia affinis]|uniref:DDE Tnp4 domain-containing protein n=1 Tax=Aldrovandia affinis TaxID=143900 RepID=A0AAD7W818_9TELE|nr:hypothetical protein AAFF_G00159050 [Aldrovandia affinis]